MEKRLGLDPLALHELYIPYAVLEELYGLLKANRKARVALRLLKLMAPFVAPVGGSADAAVLAAAKELGGVVLSGDAALIHEARRAGLAVALFHDKDLVFPR